MHISLEILYQEWRLPFTWLSVLVYVGRLVLGFAFIKGTSRSVIFVNHTRIIRRS